MNAAAIKSTQPLGRFALLEVTWEGLTQPGAYVQRSTGDLYRIPQEALVPGSSPIIRRETMGEPRMVLVSRNPFVTTLEARRRCAQHNIEPNF